MDFGLSALLTTGSGFEVDTFLASTSIARELGARRLSVVLRKGSSIAHGISSSLDHAALFLVLRGTESGVRH
jgi:hypothetical protein